MICVVTCESSHEHTAGNGKPCWYRYWMFIFSLYNDQFWWSGLWMISLWRHQMETFSALLALCVGNSPVTGDFPAQRPVTQSFDIFLDLRLNKRLSKQWWGWWSETPSRSLWRKCNDRSGKLDIVIEYEDHIQHEVCVILSGKTFPSTIFPICTRCQLTLMFKISQFRSLVFPNTGTHWKRNWCGLLELGSNHMGGIYSNSKVQS